MRNLNNYERTMKKYLLFCFILNTLMFVSCTPEEANVKIKAGVIMKSGDVKRLARRDFLITKTNLIRLWNISKKEDMKDLKSIKNEIKEEIDYHNKINKLQNELNKYQKSLSNKTRANGPVGTEILDKLIANINSSISRHSKYKKDKIHLEYILSTIKRKRDKLNYEKIKDKIKPLKSFYEKTLEKYYRGHEYDNFLRKQLKELKGILKLIDEVESEIKKDRANILKITDKINKLKEEIKLKANEQFTHLESKAIENFQMKIKSNIIKSLKTNLDGEATFTIEKGEYYLFGMAQLAQSKLIWNIPVTIENSEHYIELSNDNAFAIDGESFFYELSEALKGI